MAADAGLCLYVTLIALSVAAFVCRLMVYAVWSSLNNEESAVMDVEQPEKEDYSSIKKWTVALFKAWPFLVAIRKMR